MRAKAYFRWALVVTAVLVDLHRLAAQDCGARWLDAPDEVIWDYRAIYAITTWDPDGAGPQPERLIAGGYSAPPDGGPPENIAAWDGARWHPLGNGIVGDSSVHALAVYNGELIAGGYFTAAGGVPANSIARWDGARWQPLGKGLGGSAYEYPFVYALTVYHGELIAGGISPPPARLQPIGLPAGTAPTGGPWAMGWPAATTRLSMPCWSTTTS